MNIVWKTLFGCALLFSNAYGQEVAEAAHNNSAKHTFRISAALGHSLIRKGVQADNSYGISAASWALDADYWLTNHFGIGVHNDVVLENFIVEEHIGENDKEVIEREYPVAVVPVALFKTWEHLIIMGGVGEEFSKEKNFMVVRTGLEYGFHLPHDWELGLTVNYDVKKNAYDTWMFGLGVSKILRLHHRHHI